MTSYVVIYDIDGEKHQKMATLVQIVVFFSFDNSELHCNTFHFVLHLVLGNWKCYREPVSKINVISE